MGLPIWRDPDEEKQKRSKSSKDTHSAARSSIRRRQEVHGRRSVRSRTALDSSSLPPRFQRSPPPSVGFNGLADSRRRHVSGVPPVSTLLEHVDPMSRTPSLPVPRPVPRNAESGRLRDRLASTTSSQERAAIIREHAAIIREHQRSSLTRRAEGGGVEVQELSGELVPLDSAMSRSLTDIASMLGATSGNRPASTDRTLTRPTNLPTPPRDASGPDMEMSSMPEAGVRMRNPGIHPLSNSWRPDSSVDGLGDRNRSPTPADGWEIMRTTITPDATLPSADSSFTSAAVSQSFGSNPGTTIVDPRHQSSSDDSRHNSSEGNDPSDSASSVDSDDGFVCDPTEDFAYDMYFHEMATAEGRDRVEAHQAYRRNEGNRFALAHEPLQVDLGFRLIEEALESPHGRERLSHLGLLTHRAEQRRFQRLAHSGRHMSARSGLSRVRRRSATIMDDEPPTPHPESRSESSRNAARDVREQVDDYFRRYATDSLMSRPTSPHGRHDPVEVSISRDEPEALPVSPPTHRGEREVSEAILSDNDAELNAMRQIIEEYAHRGDVPDSWWTSIGVDLSRLRATHSHRSPAESDSATTILRDRARGRREI